MAEKIALITGASRGIGAGLAKYLTEQEYTVFGTSRNPSQIPDTDRINGVTYLTLDMENRESIRKVADRFTHIDLLINNAGSSQIGIIEETTMDSIERLFEINTFGHIYLTKLLIPLMKQQNKGTIINITSMAGMSPMPFSPIYAATKAAMDAFTKSLYHELLPYGIKITAIAPFHIKTTIPQKIDYKEDSPYLANLKVVKAKRDADMDTATSVEKTINQISKILKKKHPGPHYPVGNNRKILYFLIRHLPQKLMLRLVRKDFNLDY